MTGLYLLLLSGSWFLIAWMCWRLSRKSIHLSILNQCISDMLAQPRAAEAIAEATMQDLKDRGLWGGK
jgi:hypothetical protein